MEALPISSQCTAIHSTGQLALPQHNIADFISATPIGMHIPVSCRRLVVYWIQVTFILWSQIWGNELQCWMGQKLHGCTFIANSFYYIAAKKYLFNKLITDIKELHLFWDTVYKAVNIYVCHLVSSESNDDSDSGDHDVDGGCNSMTGGILWCASWSNVCFLLQLL